MRITPVILVMASLSVAHADPIATAHHAIIDGRPDAGPIAAVGALLATADDGRSHEGAFMCSAVLVAPTVALTAAHCVALVEADAVDEGWRLDWWVSFAPDVRGFDGPDPVLPPLTVGVRRAVVHPGFDAAGPVRSDRPDAAHDIAVLLLAEPAPVTAAPMARPGDGIQHGTPDGMTNDSEGMQPVFIAGYGLQAFDPDAVTGLRLGGPSRVFAIGDRELRVGRRLALDDPAPDHLAEKCGGDSGGPTFARTATGWRVVGLTSRGHATDPGCAIAGLDTRVDAYAGWIDAVVRAPTDAGGCTAAPGRPTPLPGAALAVLVAALGLRLTER